MTYKSNRQLYHENKQFYLQSKRNYLNQKKVFLEWPDPEREQKLDEFWKLFYEVFKRYDKK